jgi:flagellar basal-body rod modification protein FlgD
MAVDNVVTQSAVGVDGNSYTTAISNDKLTNDDFLKLMLEEMKQQDPTKPMDSAALMDSQLKMSTIQSNQDMSASLKSLQASYATSALSTAANMIGHYVSNGSTNDKGEVKLYKVETVENTDGELFLSVKEAIGVKDSLKNNDTESLSFYDPNTGFIFEDNTKTPYRVSLDANGRFESNEDGGLKLLDEDGNIISDDTINQRYEFSGSFTTHATSNVKLALNNITEVR